MKIMISLNKEVLRLLDEQAAECHRSRSEQIKELTIIEHNNSILREFISAGQITKEEAYDIETSVRIRKRMSKKELLKSWKNEVNKAAKELSK